MDVETQEIRQARQRASVKWLLSKAFNNRVPDNLKEPFYRDHENQERLKPQIIVELGNATLYCQTLSNLYSDPNYQSMNHWSIIQTLARKGVPVAETSDMPITETVLIQTNPLRINAHMSVIESLMVLYAKEISSGDRVMAAIRRISGNNYQAPAGQSYEQALLGWISHACAALKKRIIKEVDAGLPDDNGSRLQTPDIPPVRDFQDLCDGICLALLISYYCPKVVPWTSVRINYLPAVEDSIHNILLVCNFSQKHLPYSVFHMTPEDVTYMRGSMKLNLVVLLTDLFNLFEIHPAKCVCYPGMDGQDVIARRTLGANEHGICHRRGLTVQPVTPIPDLRSDLDQPPVGSPQNRPPFQGRRSRRNSSSEDSQLTIENFGGSQDQLNTLGRYERDRERKLSNTSVGGFPVEPAVAVRSSIADARGTLQLGYDTDSGSEKQDRETEKYSMRRQVSVDNVPTVSSHNLSNAGSPLPMARHKQHSSDKDYGSNSGMTMPDTFNDSRSTSGYDPESTPVRKSSTSSMPASPAAWQLDVVGDDDMRSLENASKLSTIRMKLEEKRRRIEQDKRKIEMALLRHQEKEDLESCPDVMKWETMSNESKRTPDMDPVDLDKYQQQTYGSQQHLADHHYQQSRPVQQSFGSSPHLPQAYNAPVSAYSSRPPSRDPYQQQLQHQQHQQQQPMAMPQPMQYVNEHGQYMSPPQPAHYMQQQQQVQQQQQPQSIYSDNGAAYNHSNHSPYGGAPPQYRSSVVYDDYGQPTNHFYLHESSPQPQPHPHPQRRTWAHSAAAAAYEQQQQIQPPLVDVNAWQTQQQQQQQQQHQQKQKQTWMNRPPSSAGAPSPGSFVLHQNGGGSGAGGGGELQHLFQVQASPQHAQRGSNGVQRQQSLTNLRDNRSPKAPQPMGMPMGMAMQHEDMMAPQSICFIGDEEDVDELERNIIESMQSTRISDFVHQQQQQHQQQLQQQQQRLQGHSGRGSSSEDYDSGEMISNKLNITSGNLTYRIPSPSRPSIQANSFQDPRAMASGGEDQPPEKGFYISFDDEQPKRPKPPLRAKRSPKKEAPPGSRDSVDHQATLKRESLSQLHNNNNSIGFGGEDVNSKSAVTRHSIHGLNHSNSVKSPGNATYNKYTDEPPIQLRQLAVSGAVSPIGHERRHLEDVTNQPPQQMQQQPMSPTRLQQNSNIAEAAKNKALVIGADTANLDPDSVDEMERRKEKIMLLSLQRRQQQEEAKARKEIESSQKREKEREKEEERSRKKEEQMARRAAILEQHRLKKAIEEAEREGKTLDRPDLHVKLQPHSSTSTTPRLRQQRTTRPRPKTIHVDDASVDISEASSISSRGKKGSSSNLTGYGQLSSNSMKRDYYRGSQDSLTVKESPDDYPSTSSTPIGRRGSYKTSREPAGVERGRTLSRISVAKGSTLNFRGRKSNSLMNLCGPKLYKQPAAKSNRGIILNAVEYCVFPGVVNREAKQKVLEKIARSEAKHFLVLFRDAGCQFRALYSYQPETDQVTKLYGTGPSQVDEVMFDKFFKYNSGGKCFSQVHTKHLTVTIDAFTIHNSLWQGKRVQLPSKKDMALVI
ncbi:patronin isoform X45 [Drosophila gunungcola]|uniref:patronin isoform X45 n=1 Tax=Drosophila gunungcola TaxID=103775 RepID=UPI0022E8CF4B|nr:patronin isoform X45 [Drosophila gunungcola]